MLQKQSYLLLVVAEARDGSATSNGQTKGRIWAQCTAMMMDSRDGGSEIGRGRARLRSHAANEKLIAQHQNQPSDLNPCLAILFSVFSIDISHVRWKRYMLAIFTFLAKVHDSNRVLTNNMHFLQTIAISNIPPRKKLNRSVHLPLVERFERGGGLGGRQAGSGLMLVENGVLSSGREVFVRGCLQPGAEGGTTAGRAGTGGEIAAGSRMTRPVRIRITVGRCAAVATSAVTARWCLDHSIRCSHLHVGRCPPDEDERKPPYLAAALEYGAVAAADGLIDADEGNANELRFPPPPPAPPPPPPPPPLALPPSQDQTPACVNVRFSILSKPKSKVGVARQIRSAKNYPNYPNKEDYQKFSTAEQGNRISTPYLKYLSTIHRTRKGGGEHDSGGGGGDGGTTVRGGGYQRHCSRSVTPLDGLRESDSARTRENNEVMYEKSTTRNAGERGGRFEIHGSRKKTGEKIYEPGERIESSSAEPNELEHTLRVAATCIKPDIDKHLVLSTPMGQNQPLLEIGAQLQFARLQCGTVARHDSFRNFLRKWTKNFERKRNDLETWERERLSSCDGDRSERDLCNALNSLRDRATQRPFLSTVRRNSGNGGAAALASSDKMATPSELSLEEIRKYLLENGGTARNHDVVKHFKKFLTDPETRAEARNRFKEYVNTLATIKNEEGEKYLVLKKKYRQNSLDLTTPDQISSPIGTPDVATPVSPLRVPPPYRPPPPAPLSPPANNASTRREEPCLNFSREEATINARINNADRVETGFSTSSPPVPPRRKSQDKIKIENKENVDRNRGGSEAVIKAYSAVIACQSVQCCVYMVWLCRKVFMATEDEAVATNPGSTEQLSFRERMQRFNRMASETDLQGRPNGTITPTKKRSDKNVYAKRFADVERVVRVDGRKESTACMIPSATTPTRHPQRQTYLILDSVSTIIKHRDEGETYIVNSLESFESGRVSRGQECLNKWLSKVLETVTPPAEQSTDDIRTIAVRSSAMGADEDDSASVASQLDGKSREWLVRAAQGDYQALAKLAAEEPRLTRLKAASGDNDKGGGPEVRKYNYGVAYRRPGIRPLLHARQNLTPAALQAQRSAAPGSFVAAGAAVADTQQINHLEFPFKSRPSNNFGSKDCEPDTSVLDRRHFVRQKKSQLCCPAIRQIRFCENYTSQEKVRTVLTRFKCDVLLEKGIRDYCLSSFKLDEYSEMRCIFISMSSHELTIERSMPNHATASDLVNIKAKDLDEFNDLDNVDDPRLYFCTYKPKKKMAGKPGLNEGIMKMIQKKKKIVSKMSSHCEDCIDLYFPCFNTIYRDASSHGSETLEKDEEQEEEKGEEEEEEEEEELQEELRRRCDGGGGGGKKEDEDAHINTSVLSHRVRDKIPVITDTFLYLTETALHWAAKHGDENIVKLIAGTYKDYIKSVNETSRHYAKMGV
ncbi:Ankyrin repeat domain-containing protein SOWAHB [Melipona quadrifasciata]|uniref:Ankyrin repeat domain-containing protein SOWAHB n=1 Tax=Melipona quadrifasciata TaxID=166423 RepID=A0A0M9A7Z4_9HYME|nr:Ankyrin repeat domain-containing protein SOWAHB [Melipona quadrifasciata]